MDLSDLRQSISTLTDEQLFVLLKDIRTNRRIPKAGAKHRKATNKKPSQDISLDALLASASPEQLEQLIAQLEKQGGKQ
jgi:hypothetical protein